MKKFATLLGLVSLVLAVSYLLNPAAVERLFSPHLGTCNKCERPWNHVDHHVTPLLGVEKITVDKDTNTLVLVSSGMFPLCEACWAELKTGEARLPYYRMTYDEWLLDEGSNFTWEEIRVSVFFEATGEIPDPIALKQ
jgi:hypothetical protein